jgi:hypothetical protein
MIKIWKIGLFLAMIFFLNGYISGQTLDPLPDDGSGQYLDEVPIRGEIFFILVALGVGVLTLFRKKKSNLSDITKNLSK